MSEYTTPELINYLDSILCKSEDCAKYEEIRKRLLELEQTKKFIDYIDIEIEKIAKNTKMISNLISDTLKEKKEKVKVNDNEIKIPLTLAWEIFALLRGLVIEEDLESLPYETQGQKVCKKLSKLLEPYRKK